jgi:uncharacterized protein
MADRENFSSNVRIWNVSEPQGSLVARGLAAVQNGKSHDQITLGKEKKLVPVLIRLLDAIFRLGYIKFKDAAKIALDQTRATLGSDIADALTLNHLQDAYIAMTRGQEGADTKHAVTAVKSKAEIENHTARQSKQHAAHPSREPKGLTNTTPAIRPLPDAIEIWVKLMVNKAMRLSCGANQQNSTELIIPTEYDALYRQARSIYSLITDDGGTTWSGERVGRVWLPMSALEDAFDIFKQLAKVGYGKAYYPLSTLYRGKQSVEGDASLAQHFAKLAFEWCFANRLQDDPDIWNDLGHIYVHQEDEQATHWYRKAAEKDHSWGLFNLGCMYEYGYGVAQDAEEALRWQIWAAEQGNLAAIFGLIDHYEFNGPDHEQNDEQALHWYRMAADQGYPWTESDFGMDKFFDLGKRCRSSDNGDEADDEKAREYYLVAAKLGHAEAQYQLALMLAENGYEPESTYWFKCSAELGFGPAQHYYAGFVPEADAQALVDAAMAWYKTHAENGDPVWQFEYASLLLPDEDCNEGMKWLHIAAEQDYRPACARLGHEYLCADVSDHSTQQGIYWLSHAVDLGDGLACNALGDLYLLGRAGGTYLRPRDPVPLARMARDQNAAIAWYERGIDLGHLGTAFTLGHHYLTGEYLDLNLQLAEKWLLHSARSLSDLS